MRPLVFFLAFVAAADAQIQDLSTTDDGLHVYFTAPYRLKGSTDEPYLSIFRYLDGGFQSYRHLTASISPSSNGLARAPGATRPQVSGDGRTVVYYADPCGNVVISSGFLSIGFCVLTGSPAGFVLDDSLLGQSFLARPGDTDVSLGAGAVTLSPDGQFALVFNSSGLKPTTVLHNLISGAAITLDPAYQPIGDGRQCIAADGTLLLQDATGPVLWKDGIVTRLSLLTPVTEARLSADGSTIVYVRTPAEGEPELHGNKLASGADHMIAKFTAGGSRLYGFDPMPSLTRNGSLVAYSDGTQLVLSNSEGYDRREIPLPPELPAEPCSGLCLADFPTSVTISGRGNIAYVGTRSGRLLRVDVVSGSVTELNPSVPPVNYLLAFSGDSVPDPFGFVGSFSFIGSSPQVAPGELVYTQSNVDVLDENNVALPLVAATSSMKTYEIPWEAPLTSAVTMRVHESLSVFESVVITKVAEAAPQFYYQPALCDSSNGSICNEIPVAAHEDFSSLVTFANPAHSGEIIHLYLTGLGRVSPNIATGAPAAAGFVYTVQTPVTCSFTNYDSTLPGGSSSIPVEVLFAGLAPGYVGINQVSVRIPSGVPDSASFNCSSGSSDSTAFSYIPVAP
jgi:uncharacterized protein (TIGR03437 family)